MKLLKKIKLEDLLLVFMILQPFLDIYRQIIGEKWDVLGFSLVTIIRMLFISSLFVITVIKQVKARDKNVKIIFIYLIIMLIYTILHVFNSTLFWDNFAVNNTSKAQGIYEEILYVFRLLWPICFLYVIYASKLDYKRAIKTISISVFVISIVIVVTNILKISHVAYSNNTEYIKDNIFGWFDGAFDKYYYTQLTSKGWFTGANEISAVLLFTLPIVLYNASKKKISLFDIGILLQVVAMIMIGSRTASLGWILVYAATLILYVVMQIIRKLEINKIFLIKCLIIFGFGIFLTLHSPIVKRYKYFETYEKIYNQNLESVPNYKLQYAKRIINGENLILEYAQMVENKTFILNKKIDTNIFLAAYENNDTSTLRKLIIEDYILSVYAGHYISSLYIENIYPYYNDPEFWIDVFEMPFKIKSDNRELGQLIVKRMKEKNNNAVMDTLLGCSFSTLKSRDIFVERDFISHYYSLGIIGMLLFILPYAIILILEILSIIKSYENKLWVHNIVMCATLLIAILIGFWGGHLFDEYIASFYVSLIAALLLKNVVQMKKII